MKIKTRTEPEANYKAVFFNGKTLRIPLDPSKPIGELKYPEFYDLTFGDKCSGGCKYCYAGGNPKGRHYTNIVEKIKNYFGTMTENQKPLQVAVGGSQEPLEHPEFWAAMEELKNLDIVPNYTTNGMFFDEKAVELTKKFCGGVAITLHRHLEKHWRRALDLAIKGGIKVNVHYIVSDEESVDQLINIYNEYNGKVEYFVLLPYMNVGYASNTPKTIAYDKLEQWMDKIQNYANIAFGANFYKFLTSVKKWDVSLYPPEILSKYLVFDDMKLYKSSFDTAIPVN